MSIELKVGEWYVTGQGDRVKVICDISEIGGSRPAHGDGVVVAMYQNGNMNRLGKNGRYLAKSTHPADIIRHLPGCTGWDWAESDAGWRDAKPSDFAEGVPVPCRVRDGDTQEWIELPVLGYMAEADHPFVTCCDDYASNGLYEVTAYRYCQVLDTENT